MGERVREVVEGAVPGLLQGCRKPLAFYTHAQLEGVVRKAVSTTAAGGEGGEADCLARGGEGGERGEG